MNWEELHERTCAQIFFLAPDVEGASLLVDECFADARKTFSDDFIQALSPEAWAKITLTYHKHFLDTGCEVSILEIVVAVLRDAINTSRMDMVTLNLAQQKRQTQGQGDPRPNLTLVKDP
ncbi:MAG: hypothetical protein AAF493_25430 [Pseudomonadota bacterium]